MTSTAKSAMLIGVCDSHLHVYGDAARFAFDPSCNLHQPYGFLHGYLAGHKKLRLLREAIVQTPLYSYNNDCLLAISAELNKR